MPSWLLIRWCEMKKYFKFFIISLLTVVSVVVIGIFILGLILALIFSFCAHQYDPKYIDEESLVIYTGRNAISYIYQDKVKVTINYNDRDDWLRLRTRMGEEYWYYDSITILSGTFERVGWYDDNLFILMNEKYYSFDIDEYEVPPLDEDGEPQNPDYELKEYSESEFKKLYPDYESYDWYGH